MFFPTDFAGEVFQAPVLIHTPVEAIYLASGQIVLDAPQERNGLIVLGGG